MLRESYRIQDLFPIPDGLVPAFRTSQGQIEVARRPPQILIGLYKDRCAEFHGFVCCAVIWVNCDASFEGNKPKLNGSTYVLAYGLLRSPCVQKCR